MHFFLNRVGERLRRLLRSYRQTEVCIGSLIKCVVDDRVHLGIQPVYVLIANDADDLVQIELTGVGEVDAFSNWILAVEYLVRQSLIHDRDPSGFPGILTAKEPSCTQGNT